MSFYHGPWRVKFNNMYHLIATMKIVAKKRKWHLDLGFGRSPTKLREGARQTASAAPNGAGAARPDLPSRVELGPASQDRHSR